MFCIEEVKLSSSRISKFNSSSSFLSKLRSAKLYSKINMVFNTCLVLRSSSFLHLAFRSAIPSTLSFRWCYVILDNFPSWFMIRKLLRMRYLNPSFSLCSRDLFNRSTSLLELSCVIFHLKPSLRNVAFVVLINDPSYLSIILVEEIFHPVGVINYIICFCSGRISPHNFETFSISPQQAYPFVVDNPTTLF